jgi:hypothetical protein
MDTGYGLDQVEQAEKAAKQAVEVEKIVSVTFKKSKVAKFEIDSDALTWEDLMELTEIQEKGDKGELSQRESMEAVADLLTRLTGVEMRKQPARVIGALLQELNTLAAGLQTEAKN